MARHNLIAPSHLPVNPSHLHLIPFKLHQTPSHLSQTHLLYFIATKTHSIASAPPLAGPPHPSQSILIGPSSALCPTPPTYPSLSHNSRGACCPLTRRPLSPCCRDAVPPPASRQRHSERSSVGGQPEPGTEPGSQAKMRGETMGCTVAVVNSY